MLTLATYWHTSMADRYDINDISQRLFVSILFRTCHRVNSHLGQFRGLNFYLSHESSSWEFAIIDWVLSLVTLEPQFLMIFNSWPADPILFLKYIGPSNPEQRFCQRGSFEGNKLLIVSEYQLYGSEVLSPRISDLNHTPLFCDGLILRATSPPSWARVIQV